MKNSMIPFAKRIEQYMADNGKTQYDVAKILNITPQAVSKWCVGASSPSLSKLPEIAEKLGVSMAWLIGYPSAPMTNNDEEDRELDQLIHKKLEDQQVMDEAPRQNINGSMYPVYTEDQLDKRLEMFKQALDMFAAGKIDANMLKLIVESLR